MNEAPKLVTVTITSKDDDTKSLVAFLKAAGSDVSNVSGNTLKVTVNPRLLPHLKRNNLIASVKEENVSQPVVNQPTPVPPTQVVAPAKPEVTPSVV